MKTKTAKIIIMLVAVIMVTGILLGATKCKKQTDSTDTSKIASTIETTSTGTSASGTSTSGTTSGTTKPTTTPTPAGTTTTTPTTTETTAKVTEPTATTTKPTEPTATTAKPTAAPTPTPKPTATPVPTATPKPTPTPAPTTGHVHTFMPNYINVWFQPYDADGTTNNYTKPIYGDVPVYETHNFGLVNGVRTDVTALWRESGRQAFKDAGYWDDTKTDNLNYASWEMWIGVYQTSTDQVQVGTTSAVIGYDQLTAYQVQAISTYSCTTCYKNVTLTEYLALGYTMPAGYRAYTPEEGGGTKWIPV